MKTTREKLIEAANDDDPKQMMFFLSQAGEMIDEMERALSCYEDTLAYQITIRGGQLSDKYSIPESGSYRRDYVAREAITSLQAWKEKL